MKKFQGSLRKCLLGLVILISPFLSWGIEAISDTTDIKGQFEYLYKTSNRYEQYKVILIDAYNQLKENSLDSINMYKSEINGLQNEINGLNDDLFTQKDEIEQLNDRLESALNAENSIGLLGVQITKGVYNLIMWVLVLILSGISVIVMLLYKRGHQVVRSTKERLAEVKQEFETHRKNTLVREQKLARELMDVKLKHKSR